MTIRRMHALYCRLLRHPGFALACLLLSLTTVSWQAHADSVQEEKGVNLTNVSLEDLMNMTVTSVSRTEQTMANAAAAVFVITNEDIRRSGVTSIPEALRMVPGLEVARIDSNKWAVSSRGFNGRFASKMLVQIDGRTVYNPIFSGVFWDAQDTVLEDVERIEVIRGPGATMWGSNAVNGIINIITKNAGDTKGGLLSAGGGTMERGFGTARFGTQLGDSSSLRFFVKYLDRAGMDDLQTGQEANNGWNSIRGGFRLDAEPSSRDTLTFQGDYYDERLKETYVNQPGNSSFDYTTPSSGGNLLARWKRAFSDTDDLTLQLYYDRAEESYAVLGEQRDTVDLDLQDRFALGSLQEVIWGAGYRFIRERLQFPSPTLTVGPNDADNNVYSFFVQDNISLVPDQLNLIIGSKFEHNDYTGFEVQPNARLIWTPTTKQSVWLSVSRAVRTPSRGEEYLSLTTPGPLVTIPGVPQPIPSQIQLLGSTSLKAEELIAYEAGYRVVPTELITIDAATFYNVYRQLNIYLQEQPVPNLSSAQPTVTLPMQLGNYGRAQTFGFELAAEVKALPWWRVKLAYTYLQLLSKEADQGATFPDVKGENPHNQVSLRSAMDLYKDVEFDLWLRYVDALRDFNIGSYVTLDMRLAWRPVKNLELALVGQNLLHDRQQEFVPQFINTQPTAIGRGMYGKATWRF